MLPSFIDNFEKVLFSKTFEICLKSAVFSSQRPWQQSFDVFKKVFIVPQDCLDSQTKAVFVISSLLSGYVTKRIQSIVSSSDFQHTTVICLVSPSIHEAVGSLSQPHQLQRPMKYGELARSLKMWMGSEVRLCLVTIAIDIYYHIQ